MSERKWPLKTIFITKIKLLIFLVVSLFFTHLSMAQHAEGAEDTQAIEPNNEVSLFVGNNHKIESGFNLPTFGLTYVREINHFLAFGVISEIEAGSYNIETNEANGIITGVNREGALLVLPSTFIHLFRGLTFTGGYGIEFEKNENLGLLKLGLEYKLCLANKKWAVLPSASWDHTKLFDGIVYGVSFGYSF